MLRLLPKHSGRVLSHPAAVSCGETLIALLTYQSIRQPLKRLYVVKDVVNGVVDGVGNGESICLVSTNSNNVSNDEENELDELHHAILEKLEEGRGTPNYLADHVGESRQLVSHRLRDLRMLGRVRRVAKGLYELAEDGDVSKSDEAGLSDDEDSSQHDPRGIDQQQATGQGRAGVAIRHDERRATAEEVAQDVKVPGRSAGVERVRREALLWAWDYLREHEHTTSSEIANATFGAFFDERKLKYSTSSRYPGYGLWDNYLRDCLKQLPGVDAPGEKGKDWFFEE